MPEHACVLKSRKRRCVGPLVRDLLRVVGQGRQLVAVKAAGERHLDQVLEQLQPFVYGLLVSRRVQSHFILSVGCGNATVGRPAESAQGRLGGECGLRPA